MIKLLLFIPLILIISVIIVVALKQRNKYVQLGITGVNTQSRSYVKNDGNEIVLVGMVHLGSANFYQNIKSKYQHLFALTEGVSDKNKLMAGAGNYSMLANKIGITAQSKDLFENGVNSDCDFSDLPENELKVVQGLFKVFKIFDDATPSDEKKELVKNFSTLMKENALTKDGILKNRNQILMKAIDTHEYSKIVVPWGARHLPEIEEYLVGKGYRLKETQSFEVINYPSLIRSLFIFAKVLGTALK